MPRQRQKTITQLDFERRALMARVDFAGKDETLASQLMREISDLELLIAAAPASDAGDIAIKARLLKEAMAMDDEIGIEAMLLLSIIRDCDRLVEMTAQD